MSIVSPVDSLPSARIVTECVPPSQRYAESTRRQEDAQVEMLADLFRQAPGVETKSRAGSYMPAIHRVLERVSATLNSTGTDLPTEYVFPDRYRPSRLDPDYLPLDQQEAVNAARLQRYEELGAAGKLIARQTTDERAIFRLDETPYRRQGDTGRDMYTFMQCFNACFRMVFQAVTDEALSESAVQRAISESGQRATWSDDYYIGAFATRAFRERYGVTGRSLVMTGASLGNIAGLRERLRQTRPNAAVYAITSIGSEVGAGLTWHSNVLLAADEETVAVHDPSDMERGQAYRRVDRYDFYRRWAQGLNRTHILVAERDTPVQSM